MSGRTPLGLLSMDEAETILELLDDERNEGIRDGTIHNMICFLDGEKQLPEFKIFVTVEDLIKWLEMD